MCAAGGNMLYFPVPIAFDQSRKQFSVINRMSQCTKTTITPGFNYNVAASGYVSQTLGQVDIVKWILSARAGPTMSLS